MSLATMTKAAETAVNTVGMSKTSARVGLVLDVSASMTRLFESGTVQETAERALALGMQFDDDGAIDVWSFGERVRNHGQVSETEISGYVKSEVQKAFPQYGTVYSSPIKAVVDFYNSEPGDPAYVMFVTDGNCQGDETAAKRAIIEAAKSAVFFQFIGLGEESTFDFLMHLDDMPGRIVDNANFFAVSNIHALSDSDLYAKMMAEFPDWWKVATSAGIITR